MELSRKEKNELIKAIPNYKYTKHEISKLINYIEDGRLTDVEQFPDESDKYPKATLEYDLRTRTAKIKSVAEQKEAEPQKRLTKREKEALERREKKRADIEARERADEEEEKAKKEKNAEALKKLKPYFKADEPPKGYRRATMEEAVKAKKILYWGRMKADSKMIAEQFPKVVDPNYVKPLRLMNRIELAAENGKVRAQAMRLKKRLTIGIADEVEKQKTQNEFTNLVKRIKDIGEFLKTA